MKTKQLSSVFLLIFAVLLLSAGVLGANSFYAGGVSFVTPTANGVVTGIQTINITNVTVVLIDMRNCTIYAKSSSTANSSWSQVGAFLNESFHKNYVSGTFDSNTLEDASDYELNATCRNSTNDYSSVVITGMLVDNDVPDTPSSLSPSEGSTDTDGSTVTFSANVNSSEVTSCTLYFNGKNPGATSYSMTEGTNTCSYSVTNMPEESYLYYITVTDARNSTDSATTSFRVDQSTGAGNIVNIVNQPGVESTGGAGYTVTGTGTGWINQENKGKIVFGAIVVIAIVLFFVFKKK